MITRGLGITGQMWINLNLKIKIDVDIVTKWNYSCVLIMEIKKYLYVILQSKLYL